MIDYHSRHVRNVSSGVYIEKAVNIRKKKMMAMQSTESLPDFGV